MLNTSKSGKDKNLRMSVGEDVDQLDPLWVAGVNENSAAVWKTVLQFLQTWNTQNDSAGSSASTCAPQRTGSLTQTPVLRTALLTTAKRQKQPKVDEGINTLVLTQWNTIQPQRNSGKSYMEEPWGYYAKWSQPETRRKRMTALPPVENSQFQRQEAERGGTGS